MSRRKEDWADRLNLFIEENRSTPFKYGKFDCCLAVCNAINLMTGIDPAKDFRKKYKSKSGAVKIMIAYEGVGGIAKRAFKSVGFKEVDPNFAGRGDAVLIDNKGHALGMISTCGRKVFAASESGLNFIPRKEIIKAWRIE